MINSEADRDRNEVIGLIANSSELCGGLRRAANAFFGTLSARRQTSGCRFARRRERRQRMRCQTEQAQCRPQR